MSKLRAALLSLAMLALGFAIGYRATEAAQEAAFFHGYCAGLDIADTTCREARP